MIIITGSPAETEKAGADFVSSLSAPAVVALFGDLGAGKTCFVKGAAKKLGLAQEVNSPTYAIVNTYDGHIRITHMDAYRLKSEDELMGIGFDDYLAAGGWLFIEWPERIQGLLPDNTVKVNFRITGEYERCIEY